MALTVPEKLPDLRRFYQRRLQPVEPGAFDFEFTFRSPGGTEERLFHVEQADWSEEDPTEPMSGSATARRPDAADADSLPLRRGDLVVCRVKLDRHRRNEIWTMRADDESGEGPETTLSDGGVSITLSDAFAAWDRQRREWYFRKNKLRPHGWYPEEIAAAVAREEGWQLGAVAKGTRLMTLVKRGDDRATGVAVIQEAYAKERQWSGRAFTVRVSNGKLSVLPFQRNRTIYVVRRLLQEATVRETQASGITILKGRGKIGSGKKAKAVTFIAQNERLVERFGEVEDEWSAGKVESLDDLRVQTLRRYAALTRVRRTATLTIPGVPYIRLLDGIRWITGERGWHGRGLTGRDLSFAYVSAVRNSLSPEGYTTELDIAQDDIYQLDKERREAAERRKKRAKRKAAK